MPGSFDEEQMALARKRLMLQQLANAGPVESGYHGAHWVNPYLGQLGSAITGAFANNEQQGLDARAQDIAARRGAAAEAWAANPPRMEDTPGDPGVQGTGPIAPPPNTPGVEYDQNQQVRDWMAARAAQQQGMGQDATMNMETGAPTALTETTMQPLEAAPAAPMVPQAPQDFVPNRAATAMLPKSSLGDVMQWATKGAAFSPMHAKLAEHTMQQALDAPEKARVAAAAVQARNDLAAQTVDARAAEAERGRIERARLSETASADKMQLQEYRAADRANENAQRAADRAALVGAGGGGKPQQSQYMDSTGTPLVFTNGEYTRAGDGQPPVGQLTTRGAAEKGAGEVRTADQAVARGMQALDYLEKYPGAFGGKKAVMGKLSELGGDAVEGAAKNKLYTPEEQEAQAFIGREGAQILKDLYGAALTTNEAGRATRFEYKQGDPPERIAAKIRGIMEIVRSRTENQSGAAKAIARPAAPAGTKPPLSGY
jgi:hypothetical protein